MENPSICFSTLASSPFYLFFVFVKQPLADAEGAKRFGVIELLKSYGGVSDVSSPRLICILMETGLLLECFGVILSWISFSFREVLWPRYRARVGVILNQGLYHLRYQISVTGRLTLMSWTFRTPFLLGRSEFICKI